jgi:hypothetical protein
MRRLLSSCALVSVFALLTGCSGGSTGPTTTTAGSMKAATEQQNGVAVRITIDVGGTTVTGTLNESAAARDLAARLPVTVTLSDHGGVEKTGPLSAALSIEGAPDGADPVPGDIGYYAPSEDVVLYYGDQSYFPGIVILGAMDPSGVDVVASAGNAATVTLSAGES